MAMGEGNRKTSSGADIAVRPQEANSGRERPIIFSGPMVRALLEGRKTQTRRVVKGMALDWLDDAGFTPEFVANPANRLCPYGVPGDRLWVRETWATWMHAPCLPGGMGGALSRDPDDWLYKATEPEWAAMLADRATLRAYNVSREDGSTGNYVVRPSIHMPRWASRLTLEITEVRVERLQDISEADAIAEGLYRSKPDEEDREWFRAYTEEHDGVPPTPEAVAEFDEGVWMIPGVPQGWGMTPAERRRDQWAPNPQFAYRLLWEHIHGALSWVQDPWVWAVSFEVVR
jgi:hypothetical protein